MNLTTYHNGKRNGEVTSPRGLHYRLAVNEASEDVGDGAFCVRVFIHIPPHVYAHTVSPPMATYEEALTELDRIAALIGGTAPAQGWVKGAPPLTPMAYFVAQDETGAPLVVQCVAPSETHPWANGFGSVYAPDELTHHQPAPIVVPKES